MSEELSPAALAGRSAMRSAFHCGFWIRGLQRGEQSGSKALPCKHGEVRINTLGLLILSTDIEHKTNREHVKS